MKYYEITAEKLSNTQLCEISKHFMRHEVTGSMKKPPLPPDPSEKLKLYKKQHMQVCLR